MPVRPWEEGRGEGKRMPTLIHVLSFKSIWLELEPQQVYETAPFLQRTHQCQVQPLRPEKIPRHFPDFAGGNFADALLDLSRRCDFAVAKELLADPHHLILGA